MPGKERLTTDEVIKALTDAHGLITVAARSLNVHRSTVENYIKRHPSVAQAKADAREGILDLAEGKLFQAVNAGELAAVFFVLKTIGKVRGYVERQETSGPDGGAIEIKIIDDTDD